MSSVPDQKGAGRAGRVRHRTLRDVPRGDGLVRSPSTSSVHVSVAQRPRNSRHAGCTATTQERDSGIRTRLPSSPEPGLNVVMFAPIGSRSLAEVLFVDLAVVTDHERHHAGLPIDRGVRDHREAGDHPAVDHVAVSTAGCAGALARQDPEVIAAIGCATLAPFEVRAALRDERAEGTCLVFLPGGRGPVESIVLARRAGDPLRILEHAVTIPVARGIRALRIDVRAQHVDRVALVVADAAVDQLFPALLGRETPAAAGAHDGNGYRPRLLADHQHATVLARLAQHAQRLHGCEGLCPRGRGCRRIGVDDEVLVVFAEDRDDGGVIAALQRGHQSVDRRFRRRECLLLRRDLQRATPSGPGRAPIGTTMSPRE